MNRLLSRACLIWFGFYIGLASLVAFCYLRFRVSQESAHAAALNVSVCRSLVERIEALRQRPVLAGSQGRSSDELSERIDRLGKQANFAGSSIQSIDPQTSIRVGDTAYKEQSTHVELRDVTLPQLAHFLRLLLEEDSQVRLSSVRLSAPRTDAPPSFASETWRAEVTLTYLIFSPKSPSSGS